MKSALGTGLPLSILILVATAALVLPSSEQTTTVTTVVRHNHIRSHDAQDIHVVVNQQPVVFDAVEPIMVGDAVMVPLRGVFEQLGGELRWEPRGQVIEGARPGHQFRIRVGSTNALVNGSDRTLSTPPQVIGATTYVPLRFASEALGATVSWDPDTQTATITDAPSDETVIKKTTTTTTTTEPSQ